MEESWALKLFKEACCERCFCKGNQEYESSPIIETDNMGRDIRFMQTDI